MSDAPEAIATLPFVRTKPEGVGREFWHVTPTGDRKTDMALGRGFALLALERAVATGSTSLMGWVMAEMGNNPGWRAIELGFQRTVAELACVTMSMAQGNPACACASIAERR
jgi:hypothetical protein